MRKEKLRDSRPGGAFLGTPRHGECFPYKSEHTEYDFGELSPIRDAYKGISKLKCTEPDQGAGMGEQAGTPSLETLPFAHRFHRLRVKRSGSVWGRLRTKYPVHCKIKWVFFVLFPRASNVALVVFLRYSWQRQKYLLLERLLGGHSRVRIGFGWLCCHRILGRLWTKKRSDSHDKSPRCNALIDFIQ